MTGMTGRPGRAWRAAALVGLVALVACGGGSGSDADIGVSLELRHTEPLRAGSPVRWTLVLRNDNPNRLDLTFSSGKDGDVVLRQAGREHYRWSTGRFFTEALRKLSVGGNETRTFALEDPEFAVPPGDYELVATLASDTRVPPVETTVTVTA